MGYTTDFNGSFKLNKKLDAETHALLDGLASTRRMARSIQGFGVEGEFYVGSTADYGQERTQDIIDYNVPPRTQPGLWCQWVPNSKGTEIAHDGGEKFYNYVEWIEYLIKSVLAPRGYTLTGDVSWRGEDHSDLGVISIVDNAVSVQEGRLTPKRKAKPKKAKAVSSVTVSSEAVSIATKLFPDGSRYCNVSDLVTSFKQAKAMGGDLAFIINELERIASQ